MAIYVVMLGLFRVFLSTGMEIDEAEQSYLSQWFLWGYDIQPPLYTWISIALIEVFGNHHWLYVSFRMCLFFLSYAGLYLLFSRISQNNKIGLAAVIFSLLLPQFSTESLRHTHTVLVTTASIWSLICLERIWQNPHWKYYALLGFTLSVGILSKYNFLFFISSMGLTLLLIPSWRRLLFTPKTVITFLIVALLISPHFVWVWQHLGELTSGVSSDLGAVREASFLKARFLGLMALLVNLVSFLSGFLLVFGLIHLKQIRAVSQNKSEWIQFFECFFLLVIGQFLILILFFNTTIFHERWMQPFFVFFPGYCLLKFYPQSSSSALLQNWKLFQKIGTIAVTAILLVLVTRIAIMPTFFHKTIRLNLPHERFCEDLPQLVKEENIDLIITDDLLLGGYLTANFKETIIVQEPKYALVNRQEYGEGKNALLIWTWSWRPSADYKPNDIPPVLQSLLKDHDKTQTKSDIQTYNFQYTTAKKSSYQYYILQDFGYH